MLAASELGLALDSEDLVQRLVFADFDGDCTARIYVTPPIS